MLQINFAAGGQTAAQASLHAAQIAFIGPLLGSLSRVYGGKLADRIGGGRVTLAAFWIFLAFYVLASAVTWVMYVRRPVSTDVSTATAERHASAMAG